MGIAFYNRDKCTEETQMVNYSRKKAKIFVSLKPQFRNIMNNGI